MESSAVWASNKHACSEAPGGAAGQKTVEHRTGGTPLIGEEHLSSSQTSENIEGPTQISTLCLRLARKNRCGAAKKRAKKAKLAEAPTGASDGGQPQPTSGNQPQNLQKPGTSGAYHRRGPVSDEQKSPESRGQPQGQTKRQRSARGTPGEGQAKRPKQSGQLTYARAAREGLRVAIVCKDLP
jgi:hypothetical protein